MRPVVLVSLVCVLFSTDLLIAQNPVPALRPSGSAFRSVNVPQADAVYGAAVAEQQPVPVGASGAQEAATTASTDVPEVAQQKQQILQQLFFDRRPSSILRAWALPPEEAMKSQVPDQGQPTNGQQPAQAQTPVTPVETPMEDPAKELTEEEKTAKAAAEAATKKAEDVKKAIVEFQQHLAELKLAVTKAHWPQVGELLGKFSEADRTAIYDKLLQSLITGTPDSPRNREGQIIGERNLIRAIDVIAIGELCPKPALTQAQTSQLGQLVTACNAEGEANYAFSTAIHEHTAADVPEHKLSKRVAAQILFAANRADEAIDFLPSLDVAQKDSDLEALDLLSDTLLALHQKKADRAHLEASWAAVQSILETQPKTEISVESAPPAESSPAAAAELKPGELTEADRDRIRQKALRRAVQLVPKLREELGQKWLADSFTQQSERGRRILNGIGTAAAKNMVENNSDTDSRMATLKLQQTSVEAVLTHASDSIDAWEPALHLMAVNWLREAVYSSLYDTSTSRGPRMQRDEFGNYFWTSETVSFGRQMQNGMPQAIPAGKLLDARPSDKWLKFLEPTFFPTFAMATARLHLRVKEEADAFPYIETLAPTHPDDARELVKDFFSVWAENHDPNSSRRRTGMYMFSFGYNERLNGIPLTRSHQERSLHELATWAERVRKLPLTDIDEQWISSAFTKVHSSAEVYRQDDMQAVFGSVDEMKPETLASFLQTMRNNLSSVWRAPQVQQDAGTNRKKKDIEAEVMLGYDTALKLCKDALAKHPDNWQLQMAHGALLHDLANYSNDLAKSATFTEERTAALKTLRSAAESYVAKSSELKETEYTVEAINTWFYAALGDCSIGQITQDRSPMLNQMAELETVFASLPQELQTRHRDMFANDLFARMSTVNPAVKFRYVREGLKLAGDRPQAREAQQVFDYYKDLVTEIQLKAEIDGTAKVGHTQPFGILVSIRHTKAIERESGGFSRYLQNQNSGGGYFYNNGRPNEDYRDKFEKATREALDEHFEVQSVTFEPESINSRSDAELGWRVTPYAYVLLKARGPEIDRIPPVRLDLDFLDTTGYVVLPVESAAISVDCSPKRGDSRPLSNVGLTQTLDEREAKVGKLTLEIKAVGQGIIPPLEELVDLSFADFEVKNIDDNKLSVSKFDESSSEPVVLSQHLWTVTLQDRTDQAATTAREFQFASVKIEPRESLYQRYDDADLKAVEQIVTLEQTYDKPQTSRTFLYVGILFAIVCAAGVGAFFLWHRSPTSQPQAATNWHVPEDITPFSVLTLLKSIERNNGLSAQSKSDLTRSITQIERYYFADHRESSAPDLASEARTWVSKAR